MGWLEFRFRARPILVICFPNESQRNVRLRQDVVDLERLHSCRLSILPHLLRGSVAGITQEIVGIGKTSVGNRVVRISFNRLIEKINRLGEAAFGPLVPIIKTLKVKLISLGILGVVLG